MAMNATNLYVTTCRLVMNIDVNNKETLEELFRYLPCLRQALGCTVCGLLLTETLTPTESTCQHHVCRICIGGKKRLKPSCSWCKDYNAYHQSEHIDLIIKCYKQLCRYIRMTPIYSSLWNTHCNGEKSHFSLIELINEAIGVNLLSNEKIYSSHFEFVQSKQQSNDELQHNSLSCNGAEFFGNNKCDESFESIKSEETIKLENDATVEFDVSDNASIQYCYSVPATDISSVCNNECTNSFQIQSPLVYATINTTTDVALTGVEMSQTVTDMNEAESGTYTDINFSTPSQPLMGSLQSFDIVNGPGAPPVLEADVVKCEYNEESDNKCNVSDNYSVSYVEGDSTKLTIKRTSNELDHGLKLTATPITKLLPVASTQAIKKHSKAKPKRKGCRCGNATATPGKLTCCGQRCPCYVEAKACLECRCRGCRNPHRPGGRKVRPLLPHMTSVHPIQGTVQVHNASCDVMTLATMGSPPHPGTVIGHSPTGGSMSLLASPPLPTTLHIPVTTYTTTATIPQTLRAVQTMHTVQVVQSIGGMGTGMPQHLVSFSPSMIPIDMQPTIDLQHLSGLTMKPMSYHSMSGQLITSGTILNTASYTTAQDNV